jgi:hypothetical protein
MLNGYTYTDYGLTNQLLYNYKVAAVYANGVTNFSEILPFRARDKVTQLAWNAVGQAAANITFTRKSITNGLIVTGYGAVTNSPDGTNNAILYPGVAGYSNNATAVYGVWQVSGTNGTFGSGGLQNWRLQTGNYQFQASAATGLHSTNVASHLVYMKTTNSVNLTTGQYSWDLDMVGPIPVRAALRQSGTWYVTDQLYDGLSAINIADLKDPTNQWRELTIKQDALMNGTNNPISTNLALTAVDAVGILMDNGFGNCNYRPTLLRFSKVLTELPTYTITTTVINSNDTPGVSITPQDPVVKMGDHQAFVISGGTNNSYLPYRITSLQTNGTDVAGITLSNTSSTVNFTWYDVGANGTLTATFTNRLYQLSVTNGQLETWTYTTGVPSSGWYTNGQRVDIVASNPPPGMVFAGWSGNTPYIEGQTTSPTGTVIFGLNGQLKDITLTATYAVPTYNLTVVGGSGSATGVFAGATMTIVADAAPTGMVFDAWVGYTNPLLSNVVSTTFLMPAVDVTVTSTYKAAISEVTLTASTGLGGTISPTTTNVTPGANASFTITASNFFRIASVSTNGANTGLTFNEGITSYDYVWNNVQATGSVYATFQYQVTTNGAIPVPLWWLNQFGLTNSAAALLDQDGDGVTTDKEFIAGTVPTNAASVLKAVQTTRNVVTWTPVTGRVYSVYWSTNLLKGITNMIRDGITYPTNNYTNATPDGKVNHYQVKVRLQ